MSRLLKSLILVLALGLLVSQAPAQGAAKPKADAPEAAEDDVVDAQPVKVLAVKNLVKCRMPAESHWNRVNTGQRMSLLTIISTGFNSHVKLAFADNSVVLIESATMMGISEFRKHGKVTKTHLRLKYGAIRATIHKARGPNDWRVQTPVATLSALGTKGRIVYRAGLLLQGKSGTWGVSEGPQKTVKPGEYANGENKSTDIVKAKRDLRMVVAGKGLSNQERDLLRHRGGGLNIHKLTATHNPVARPTVTSNSGSVHPKE